MLLEVNTCNIQIILYSVHMKGKYISFISNTFIQKQSGQTEQIQIKEILLRHPDTQ